MRERARQVQQSEGEWHKSVLTTDSMGVVSTSDGSLASSKVMAISLAHISQRSMPLRSSESWTPPGPTLPRSPSLLDPTEATSGRHVPLAYDVPRIANLTTPDVVGAGCRHGRPGCWLPWKIVRHCGWSGTTRVLAVVDYVVLLQSRQYLSVAKAGLLNIGYR